MLVFRITRDDSVWGPAHLYAVEASRRCGLPGVHCPSCGTWAVTGVAYPTIDWLRVAAVLPEPFPSPVPLDEYRQLAELVVRATGRNIHLYPGTEFGPLHGSATGDVGDFAWVNRWTPLISGSSLRIVRCRGIAIPTVLADLRLEGVAEPFYDIEAAPTARVHRDQRPAACPMCGRIKSIPVDDIVLEKNSLDRNAQIQRILEMPTLLVVSGDLAQAMLDMRLRDVLLHEVSVR